MDISEKDTIISLISSGAGGSVSLVRVSGSLVPDLAKKHFRGNGSREFSGGRFYHGHIVDDSGNEIDDVILLYFSAPNSYTGEHVLEISCHANPFIIADILEVFVKSGCRNAEPGEFTKRAFFNGKMDLVQAEAVADLIMSKSKAGVKNSLMQVDGKLSSYLKKIKEQLIETAALMELDLDFSEEDLDIIEPEDIQRRMHIIIDEISVLVRSYKYGQILSRGIEVLITGKPNVGKSSLMNAVLEKDRVIVSEIPGTTRDMIHEDMVIENTLIRFIDSAGIRLTDDLLEKQGVSRASSYMEHADIIILLMDISKPVDEEDFDLVDRLSTLYASKIILCGNKVDLGIHKRNRELISEKNLDIRYISATNGNGLNTIKKQIVQKVHSLEDHLPEEMMISNARQHGILLECMKSLETAVKTLENKMGFEFVAVDLRAAIDKLSEITGEITTDDILNTIFSHFCIGK